MEPLWTREEEQALERRANQLLAAAPANPEYPAIRDIRRSLSRQKESPFCEALAENKRVDAQPLDVLLTDATIAECAAAMERAGLKAEERAIVFLTRYHAWTHEDVGRIFGYTGRTVRNRLQSAFRKLAAARGS